MRNIEVRRPEKSGSPTPSPGVAQTDPWPESSNLFVALVPKSVKGGSCASRLISRT